MKTRTFLSRISPVLAVALVLLVLILLGSEIGAEVQYQVSQFFVETLK